MKRIGNVMIILASIGIAILIIFLETVTIEFGISIRNIILIVLGALLGIGVLLLIIYNLTMSAEDKARLTVEKKRQEEETKKKIKELKNKIASYNESSNEMNRCPYCNSELETIPKREKQCLYCKNYIYVHKNKLFTEEQLDNFIITEHTKRMEEFTKYHISEAIKNGDDLVQIDTHSDSCEKCKEIDGKIFSISGKNSKYPKLTKETTPPIHPGCSHCLMVVFEKIK